MPSQNDPELIHVLRAWRAQGKRAAEMLRYLDRHHLSTVEMMDYFREAFGLDSYAVAPIGGWFADGAGELDDEAVSALLDRAIERREGRPQA